MSKLPSGLGLFLALALPLTIALPSRADISDLIGKPEAINTTDLTDLATGKKSRSKTPKKLSFKPKNKQVIKKLRGSGLKSIANQPNSSKSLRGKYYQKWVLKPSLAVTKNLKSPELSPPADLSILSELY